MQSIFALLLLFLLGVVSSVHAQSRAKNISYANSYIDSSFGSGQSSPEQIQLAADNPYATSGRNTRTTDSRTPSADSIENSLNFWEKRMVMESLMLLGFYNGLAGSDFSKKAREAIALYQADNKRTPTGQLTEADVLELASISVDLRSKIGWQVLTTKTGMSMYYPANLLTQRSSSGDAGGEVLSSSTKKFSLMTLQVATSSPNAIDIVYRSMVERDGKSAKITYELKKSNFFIVSGSFDHIDFYSRAEFRDGEVRGYDLIWSNQGDTEVYRNVSVLMSNHFYPFGGDPARGDGDYPTIMRLIKAKKPDNKTQTAGNSNANAANPSAGNSDTGSTNTDSSDSTNSRGLRTVTLQLSDAMLPPKVGAVKQKDRRLPLIQVCVSIALHWWPIYKYNHIFDS
jgi:hypothetical protein